MTESIERLRVHTGESRICLENYDGTGHVSSLRHVWIICVSALDLYLTELVSEVGIRLIDRSPRIMTANLRKVEVPLADALEIDKLDPASRLIFFRDRIFASVQYSSFYKPEKISEALSFIWTCPAKEKWARILAGMKSTGRYDVRTEQDVREELTLIGDRRDLIAHSVDTPPGGSGPNPVTREDASRVIVFVGDLAEAIDAETERQLREPIVA